MIQTELFDESKRLANYWKIQQIELELVNNIILENHYIPSIVLISMQTSSSTPMTIKMFFQVGWSIVGLSVIMTIYGLILLILFDSGVSDGFDGIWMLDYMYGGDVSFSILPYLFFIRDMLFFGTFPGLILVGLGFHLKKTWESSHYPW